jgi:hypothetical protein
VGGSAPLDPGGHKKMSHKIRKSEETPCFVWSAGWVPTVLFLMAEGFSCIVDVLYGGLRRNKLQFLFNRMIFSAVKF